MRDWISVQGGWLMKRKVTVSTVILLATLVAAACSRLNRDVPVQSYEQVKVSYQSSEARLLDRHGEVIHELRVDEQARRLQWTSIAEVSPALINAVVQAEDKRFFTHHGVDWMSLAAALWANATSSGMRRGASTITMQVASTLNPMLQPKDGKRRLRQKWMQINSARAMEREWSKEQILEVYLNLITFRGELQGIAAASRGLFDKDPSGITEPEALILAALVRGPNARPEIVAKRACALSAAMEQRDEVIRANVSGLTPPPLPFPLEGEGEGGGACKSLQALARASIGALPHVRPRVALAPHVARQLLTRGVKQREAVSTLDAATQRYATEALQHQLQQLLSQNVRDGAVLAVDNASGEVLAYVGNAGNNPAASYVDGVRSLRQAGSTLKPFLYELALEKRLLTAASLLNDAPVNLLTPTGLYVPQNYDKEFRGWVSVRTALAGSLNVPAVRTLMLVGVDNFADQLRRLGFTGLTESGDYYGYSLALGSAEVTLWQLVNAYRALANGGEYRPLTVLPRDHNQRHSTMETPSPSTGEGGDGGEPAGFVLNSTPTPTPTLSPERGRGFQRLVMDANAAFIVSNVLADRSARSVTFGLANSLALPFWAAVKTGTSKDMRDNWCVGYSQRYTVGVWIGNFNGEPMHDVSGVTGAAPVWAEVMQYLHRGAAERVPVAPTGVVARVVRFERAVEPARTEFFVEGTETHRIALTAESVRSPRIIYPGNGMVIALDPDIPPDRQRVFFAMEPHNTFLSWKLDGQKVPEPYAGWRPRHGHHVLTLVDQNGASVGTVEFQVRGPARSN